MKQTRSLKGQDVELSYAEVTKNEITIWAEQKDETAGSSKLISGVQQAESAKHICLSTFFVFKGSFPTQIITEY